MLVGYRNLIPQFCSVASSMVTRTSPFRIPFPRRFLIRIHLDLFQIARHTREWSSYPFELTLVEKMVLISEDRKFFRHNGFDGKALAREILKAASFRKFGGASTIDMQFVRTATGYYEPTIRRKLYEILLAYLIQFRYMKIEILRSYLDCAFFGSHIYGVKKAANVIFNKHPDTLNRSEASIIAAMLVDKI
jgi:membrane peptidoglycan carboxypeptidase